MLKLNWTGDVDEKNYELIVGEITDELGDGQQTLDVELTINCSGGSIIDALAFFDFIRLNNVQLTTFGLGRLYLPAITILLSGQERKASSSSVFMAEPVEYFLGSDLGGPHHYTLLELREALDGLENQVKHVHEVFADKCGRDKSVFESLFSNNRTFDAKFAESIGIIQEVF